jgi:hypothetical protein
MARSTKKATTPTIQRPPAEVLHAAELQQLQERDRQDPRPANWVLTPRSILDFILGNTALGIEPKFVGSRNSIERCIVSLATNRGLMLIGEPGTAKSYLSELLAAEFAVTPLSRSKVAQALPKTR